RPCAPSFPFVSAEPPLFWGPQSWAALYQTGLGPRGIQEGHIALKRQSSRGPATPWTRFPARLLPCLGATKTADWSRRSRKKSMIRDLVQRTTAPGSQLMRQIPAHLGAWLGLLVRPPVSRTDGRSAVVRAPVLRAAGGAEPFRDGAFSPSSPFARPLPSPPRLCFSTPGPLLSSEIFPPGSSRFFSESRISANQDGSCGPLHSS